MSDQFILTSCLCSLPAQSVFLSLAFKSSLSQAISEVPPSCSSQRRRGASIPPLPLPQAGICAAHTEPLWPKGCYYGSKRTSKIKRVRKPCYSAVPGLRPPPETLPEPGRHSVREPFPTNTGTFGGASAWAQSFGFRGWVKRQ